MGSDFVAGNYCVIVTIIFYQKKKKKTQDLVSLLHFLLRIQFIKVEAKQNKSNMNNETRVRRVCGTVGNGTNSKAQYKNR